MCRARGYHKQGMEKRRMGEVYELGPVEHITVGTVGEPGQRVFFLQGSDSGQTISLIIEKEQAQALANAIEQLLEELEEERELPPAIADDIPSEALALRQPVQALFRVAQMGLGYDPERDLVVIAAQELTFDDTEEPSLVRFWATRTQLAALARHARTVVAAGRPICPLCGRPIDPEGHFCPRSNGHAHD